MSTAKQSLALPYVLISAAAVFLSFFLHEFSHWATGTLLGYKMALTLNSVYPVNGSYDKEWHYTLISAVGPIFTITQAIIFYFIIRRRGNSLLYPFLFTPLYMRILAGAMNFINLNDEGRISKALGIGTYTLSVMACALLFGLVYKTSKRQGYTVKFNMLTLMWVIVFSSVIILADMFWKVRVI